MAEKTQNGGLKGCVGFIMSRRFWINLLLIGVFLVATVFLTFRWLASYTLHGEQLELPDYVGQNFNEADEDASDRSFRMVILDSIHVVGKPGNVILQQNPLPGSMVKDNRTIYVTTTKQSADQISVGRLPVLYGKNFYLKKRELYESFQLESEVVGERYDSGEPGHILMVMYGGDTIVNRRGRRNNVMIDKGGKLQFVVSKNTGGELSIPDLVCLTYAEARFLIFNSGLRLGEVVGDIDAGVVDSAFVIGQVPDPNEGSMQMGDTIRLSLSLDKPLGCR